MRLRRVAAVDVLLGRLLRWGAVASYAPICVPRLGRYEHSQGANGARSRIVVLIEGVRKGLDERYVPLDLFAPGDRRFMFSQNFVAPRAELRQALAAGPGVVATAHRVIPEIRITLDSGISEHLLLDRHGSLK